MKFLKREKGYTLVGVLLIFTIISILGISLVSLSFTSIKTSQKQRENQAVFYVAEAGLNYKMNEISNELKEVQNIVMQRFASLEPSSEENFSSIVNEELDKFKNKLMNTTDFLKKYTVFEEVNGQKPWAEYSIVDDGNSKYTLTSTGHLDNEVRQVFTTFSLDYNIDFEEIEGESTGELPPFAVFTDGQFTMSNGIINGDIGTTSNNKATMKFPSGGPSLNGDIYVPKGDSLIVQNSIPNSLKLNPPKVLDDIYTIPELPDFPTIPSDYTILPDRKEKKDSNETYVIQNKNLNVVNWITSGYVLKVEENLEFNQINLNENNTLYLDIGDRNVSIVVNKLNMINGHIKIKGTGNLTMYVRNEIVMGSGSHFNEMSKLEKLNIFYGGNKSVILAGEQKVYGSIFVKDAGMNLTGSGGIYGNIFTGGSEIKMGGGSEVLSQLILAPSAHVNVTEGGSIKGKIMTDKFTMSGGANITLEEPFILNGPISPAALGADGGGNESGSGSNNQNNNVKPLDATFTINPTPTREK